jgi:hypothetical protein
MQLHVFMPAQTEADADVYAQVQYHSVIVTIGLSATDC